MKNIFFVLLIVSCLFLGTSCTKMTNRGIEIEYRTDTVGGFAKDTTFVIDVMYWNGFSYSADTLVPPGPSSYFNTSEGIKFLNPTTRTGLRLQTKNEVSFKNKVVYLKWKVNGNNEPVAIAPTLKYDPFTSDNASNLQGVYLSSFSITNRFGATHVPVQSEVWYYTRAKPIIGTDIYEINTSTGNYDNLGGIVIYNRTIPLYTKSGYISIVFTDNHSSGAYAVLGEFKIMSN